MGVHRLLPRPSPSSPLASVRSPSQTSCAVSWASSQLSPSSLQALPPLGRCPCPFLVPFPCPSALRVQGARNGHGTEIETSNANASDDADGSDVGGGGGHRDQICQNGPKNVLDVNESANVYASRRRISLSLCPLKSESGIGPMRRARSGAICEIGSNDDDGLRSDEISRNCGSDGCQMTLSA